MGAARFVVSGKVQGVWFRASTREQAISLHLQGVARNLPDGSVEVLAIGATPSLDALEAWLRHGPPLARVSEVRREPLENAPRFEGFSTL